MTHSSYSLSSRILFANVQSLNVALKTNRDMSISYIQYLESNNTLYLLTTPSCTTSIVGTLSVRDFYSFGWRFGLSRKKEVDIVCVEMLDHYSFFWWRIWLTSSERWRRRNRISSQLYFRRIASHHGDSLEERSARLMFKNSMTLISECDSGRISGSKKSSGKSQSSMPAPQGSCLIHSLGTNPAEKILSIVQSSS